MSGWWLLAFAAVFLIGLTKSGFGSGVGLMIVPMTAIALKHIPERGSEAALGLLLPLLVIGDLIAVWQYRHLLLPRHPAVRVPVHAGVGDLPTAESAAPAEPAPPSTGTILGRLLPGTLVGVVGGGALLWWFHQQPPKILVALIRMEIGFESILLVGLHWWRTWRGVQTHLLREPVRSHLTGAFAGGSSTLAHAAGPIIAMYLLPLRLDRRLYVGTCAIYFFILNTCKLPAYWVSGQFAKAELGFTLRFLPLVIAGALFGFAINRRLNDKLFTNVVYAITFVLGWYMLADGAVLLLR